MSEGYGADIWRDARAIVRYPARIGSHQTMCKVTIVCMIMLNMIAEDECGRILLGQG
jgi:hypothetical protein